MSVLLFGQLRETAGFAECTVDADTVDEAWHQLCSKQPALARHRDSVRPAVDLAYGDWGHILQVGETVAFIPPVAGGAGARVETALTRKPVDVAALMEGARADADGAVDCFLGVVRNHNDGVRVSRLDYEAYEPMARALLQELAERVARVCGVSALLAVHRLGELAVGDVALAVVAAAPHREAAFAACRQVVDAIKADVPIFKREHTDAGVHWVDARHRHPAAAR